MKYSTRSLTIRSQSGRLAHIADSFSTDFVREADMGLKSVSDSEILEAAFRILAKRMARGSALASPVKTKQYLNLRFAELEHEVFAAIFLDLCGAAVYAETLHYSAALA